MKYNFYKCASVNFVGIGLPKYLSQITVSYKAAIPPIFEYSKARPKILFISSMKIVN